MCAIVHTFYVSTHTQVLLSSSAAGQCGATAMCDASVSISDVSLTFDSLTVVAGGKTGLKFSMVVAVPIQPDQTIDVGLPGFSTSGMIDFSFDTMSFETDSAFLLNDVRSIPVWSKLGCIRDSATTR